MNRKGHQASQPSEKETREQQKRGGTDIITEHDQIAVRAYGLWEKRGRPIGSAEEDWFRAEQEIRNEAVESLKSKSAVKATAHGSAR